MTEQAPLLQRWSAVMMNNYGTPPLALASGDGAVVTDVDGAPEADVDVGAPRLEWVRRPVPSRDQRTDPDRGHAHVLVEPVQELREPLDRHLDVLDHPFAGRPAVSFLDPIGNVEALVVADQLPVEAAPPEPARPPAADPRVLRTERP